MIRRAAILAVLVAALTACTLTADAPTAGERKPYVLGAEDVVTIHAANAPDLSEKTFRVDADGELKLPMVGRIHAAGLTLDALEGEIAKGLKLYLEQPDVIVGITEYRSQPVSVLGAVTTPGVHQLEGQKTLLEMLAAAGGVRTDAGVTVTVTRRLEFGRIPVPNATEDATHQFSIAEINLKSVMEARTPEDNIVIRPHDVLSVAKAEMVYVIGEVAKAGSIQLSDGQGMSVLEALASSGGLLRTAAGSHCRILRPVAGQNKHTELDLNVTRMLAGKAEDMPILAGDILIVPGSTGKRAALRTLEAAISAGTLVASYGALH